MKSLRFVTFFFACLLAFATQAKEVVMTLDVSGDLEVGPDGRVLSHTLDNELHASVAAAIAKSVAAWAFEPVLEDGKPVIAVTRMHLTIEAVEQSRDAVALRLKSVWFGESLVPTDIKPPRYPTQALSSLVDAKVIVALRLDAEGRVIDAHPYQTSFAPGIAARVAKRLRPKFEEASLDAARLWRFAPQPSRPEGRTVFAPITFVIKLDGNPGTQGLWMRWAPGEIIPPPWKTEQSAADISSLKSGSAMLTDERLRLKTDVVGGLL